MSDPTEAALREWAKKAVLADLANEFNGEVDSEGHALLRGWNDDMFPEYAFQNPKGVTPPVGETRDSLMDAAHRLRTATNPAMVLRLLDRIENLEAQLHQCIKCGNRYEECDCGPVVVERTPAATTEYITKLRAFVDAADDMRAVYEAYVDVIYEHIKRVSPGWEKDAYGALSTYNEAFAALPTQDEEVS